MKLFVDDVRSPHDPGWTVARTVDEAKRHLATDTVEMASLDHDLGACSACMAAGVDVGAMTSPETTFSRWCPHAADGTALARWMVESSHVPSVVYVHSMNPVGRARMNAILGLTR